jgi:flagellar motor switch protein FliM
MNDVLSQAEIDKLLNELIAGEAVEPVKETKDTIKTYDFRTANRSLKSRYA